MTFKRLKMKLKERTRLKLRYAIVSLFVICITPLCERGRMLNGAHSDNSLAGRNLTCVIDLGDEMYGGHGLETGMNYELLCRFAEDNRCNVSIISSSKGENTLDSLKTEKADIVISHMHDLISDSISLSRPLNTCSAWAVRNDREDDLRQINIWISHIRASGELDRINSRYSSCANPVKRAENGVTVRSVSPYDDLLKKYAAQLGWDWRMLAAVVYQESKFSINSRSHRGAQGLMQVMPGTAEYYGVDDLLDPEKNLMAGTSHLKRLQRIFSKHGLSGEELVKFTLAAYNAGEGRIIDCRNFAEARQVDNSTWDGIVSVIPLMREDAILEEESVRLGKFQGHETIAYVENIMTLYNAICTICPA